MTRYVTADDPTRDRFGLYRLCHCLTCEGQKRVELSRSGRHRTSKRCPDCRGEGRTLQEVASCESAEALGVALVTLAREDEFSDCPIGVLDRFPECEGCHGTGHLREGSPDGPRIVCTICGGSGLDRQPPCDVCEGTGEDFGRYDDPAIVDCSTCHGSGVKPTGTWLVKPWLPSPRNASDAGRLLRSRREDVKA